MNKWTKYILIAFSILAVLLSPFQFNINHDVNNTFLPSISTLEVEAQGGPISKEGVEVIIKDKETKEKQDPKTIPKPEGALEWIAYMFTLEGIFDVINMLLTAVYSSMSYVLFLAGFIFNITIILSIAQMGAILQIEVINESWTILRDIANTLFVFLLLYAGVRTIIGQSTSSVKKIITLTIVSAVLVNFSLFFTKVLVDASNIISLSIYNQIVVSNQTEANNTLNNLNVTVSQDFVNNVIIDLNNKGGGLAGAYANAFNVTKSLAPEKPEENNFRIGAAAQGQLLIRLLVSIWSIFAASALLFASGLMFFARFVFIILLLIGSPLYFAGLAFPQLSGLKSYWEKHLIKNLIFPPVFFILIYISLELINALNTRSAVSFTDKVTGSGVTLIDTFAFGIDIVFTSLLALFFLGIPLYMGNKFGEIVGFETIKKLSKPLTEPRAIVGRNVIGRAANKIKDLDYIRDSKLFQSKYGRTFIDSTLGALDEHKFGSSQSFKDIRDENKKTKKIYGQIETRKRINSALDIYNSAQSSQEEKATARTELISLVKDLKGKELLNYISDFANPNKNLAEFLSSKQMDALERSEKLETEEDKRKKIQANWNKPLTEGVLKIDKDTNSTPALDFISRNPFETDNQGNPIYSTEEQNAIIKARKDLEDTIDNAGPKRLAQLDVKDIMRLAPHFKSNIIEKLGNQDNITSEIMEDINEARIQELIKNPHLVREMKNNEVIRLHRKVLMDKGVVHNLGKDALRKIMKDSSDEIRAEVTKHLQSHPDRALKHAFNATPGNSVPTAPANQSTLNTNLNTSPNPTIQPPTQPSGLKLKNNSSQNQNNNT